MAIVPSYFSDLAQAQDLQFLLDTSQLNLEDQSLWRGFLDMGIPQVSLNFDAAIGRERIAAAASIVDSDAPAPLRSRNKLELYRGKIPAIKEKFRLNQDDMRAIEVLKSLPVLNGGSATQLIQFLNKDIQEAAVSGDKRIDIMLLQAISTLQIDVNVTNNPDGVAYGTIDLLAKSFQKQGVPTPWAANLTTATPIDDIENFINTMWRLRGRQFARILMSYELWLVFKKTTQVKTYLATFYNTGKSNGGAFAVTLNTVNEMLSANMWPQIEIVNHSANIEVDGNQTYYKPFNVNNVAFVPAGKLGVLHNAVSMEALHPVQDKFYMNFGPTLISKWAEPDPLVEFTAMEMNAFPGVNVDGIFIMQTDQTQASFV